ncbi:ATP-binding cassette domain-containing protein [Natrarchaeobaculum aegyptiacum]|uniref:Cobalamin import ATP-binding protein BtuD n=1 Tax=Natrarchaeobaculum aegyptiacum TaxID=745377 RepID=A0A2Z2HWW3_9EURY|nr:ATP-binding cassette domain-containing protein [Natrarchaeobaculum aegyptiacum]ARS91592.1 hypothetical protein B1756_18935 [Natrarchaeobaculum aegyptiacum]
MSDTDPAPTIAIESLARSFGDHDVLEDVSLTVEPGELVGLVGPNGAGKTTLLRAASGALEPDTGRVEVDGVDLHAASSKTASRLVAVVPQDTALSFSFPVRDVVAMGRYPHRSRFSPATDDDRRAVDRALERTRTVDLADRTIDEISGGQRQRVIVARAIAQETPALLLDEPTASLDVNHQLETLELVREVVDDGTAAMAAIHDLSLAARYCDRLALLAGGTIRQVGPPGEVLTADAVGDAFDASAVVATDPVSGATSITALPNRRSAAEADSDSRAGKRATVHEETSTDDHDQVHVLGAGPIASSAVARLTLAGVRPSIGPLPAGDAITETAAQFDLETFETGPFSAPSASITDDVIAAIGRADAVVVADPILGDDGAFDRILEAVLDADIVVGVSDGPDASGTSGRVHTARGVVDPERVPAHSLESLAKRLQTARVVDLESIVDVVEYELEHGGDREREDTVDHGLTDPGRVRDERTETIEDASAESSSSTTGTARSAGTRRDSSASMTSRERESAVDAETDGGVTSPDRSDDASGRSSDEGD